MKNKSNKHSTFYALLAVLLLLVFTKYSFELNIPPIILAAVIMLIAVTGDKTEVLAISICCVPLYSIIDFFLVMGSCVIIYTVKNFRTIRLERVILLGLAILAWELLHCFDGSFSLKVLIGVMIPLIYLFIIMSSDVSDVDYSFIVKAFSAACICVSLTLLTYCIVQANFDFLAATMNLRRLGSLSEDAQVSINPNALGIINTLAITGLLQLLIRNRTGKEGKAILVRCAVLFIIGMLTASRTFLVLLLLMLVLIIIGIPASAKIKFRFFSLILFLSAVLLLLYKWIFPYNFEFFVSRLTEENIWNGRDTIMTVYNQYLLEHVWILFLGVGLSNFSDKVVYTHQISRSVPHNGIQEVIVAWGLLGLILMLLLFGAMIIKSFRYVKRKNILNYIPLILILTKSMAGQMLTSPYTMLALCYAYLSLCTDFTTRVQEPQKTAPDQPPGLGPTPSV